MLDQTTYSWLKDNAIVQVKENRLEATMCINAPFQDKEITIKDLKKLLNNAGVLYGIDENILADIIDNHRIYENIIVAHGTPANQGKDGFYEFMFDTEIHKDKGPFILEDGSVDYSIMERIEMVKKGQILARYTKRYYGEDGMDVFGNTIKVQSGKFFEQVRIQAKGTDIKVNEVEENIRTLQDRISQIDAALSMIASRDANNQKNQFQKQKIQLLSTKVAINEEIKVRLNEKRELQSIIEKAVTAKIRVERYVEPGVTLSVNGLGTNINMRVRSVLFMREGGQLIQQDIVS